MSNANVGKVFNMTGGNGGGGALKLETLAITKQPTRQSISPGSPLTRPAWWSRRAMGTVLLQT